MTDIKNNQINNLNDYFYGYPLTSSYESRYYSDFINNTNLFTVYVNGVLNTTQGGGTDNGGRPGQVILTTGTSAAGEAVITANVNNIYVGNQTIIFETSVFLPILSTGVQEYEVNVGFCEITKDVTFGVEFYYDTAFTGNNWILYCKNGGNVTQIDSGVVVVVNTWYRLSLAITNNKALFFINGNLINTLTTNFPNGVGLLPLVGIAKWVGTTARTMQVDYISLTLKFNPR